MFRRFNMKMKLVIMGGLVIILSLCSILIYNKAKVNSINTFLPTTEKDFIKWVDFDVSYKALDDAYEFDVQSQTEEVKLNWIELLAYLGAKYGGNFSKYKEKDMNTLVEKLRSKEETMTTLTKDMKHYNYFLEAYTAVLGGFVGEYEIQVPSEENPEEKVWVHKYGLKAFLPIAKFFPFSDYDDFGVSRSYGFKRQHLGHDMMGQVGTPVIATESGYVEALGWNQYGGWRLGIRSFDGKRYYYYAHLRKNFPYNKSLKVGSVVQAGDVIGYLGRTGYSRTENVNNIHTSHLHFGMQLIFDESQKEGTNEIWIDCYDIVRFLYQNRCETVKNLETKEWYRVYEFKDPAVDEYLQKLKENPDLNSDIPVDPSAKYENNLNTDTETALNENHTMITSDISEQKPQVEVPFDLAVIENEQKSVDEGHSPWKLDPAHVVQVYASLLISPEGIKGDYPIPYEDITVSELNSANAIAEISSDNSPVIRVYLKRLIRQDETGIWTVVGYDPIK